MDRSDLAVTADLALLDLADDDIDRLEGAVAQLLDYFELMSTLDVSGLPPTTHALAEGNRLRPDDPCDASIADEILEQAPELEDRLITIPNVL